MRDIPTRRPDEVLCWFGARYTEKDFEEGKATLACPKCNMIHEKSEEASK